MTDTVSEIAFVRREMIAEQHPPLAETGLFKWARENLFSSVLNSVLTILAFYFLVVTLLGVVPWMVDSSWTAGSLRECREIISATFNIGGNDGACWSVINERFLQLMYGFYPSDAYWRPNLAFVLLLVALAPVLFSHLPRKILWFSAVYPFLMPWLMWGGNVWIPLLIILGVALTYVIFVLLSRMVGNLAGLILSALFLVLWLMLGVSSINQSLNVYFADSNIDSVRAKAVTETEALSKEIADQEATKDELQTVLNEGEVRLEGLLKVAKEPWALLSDKLDYVDQIKTTISPLRKEVARLSSSLARKKLAQTEGKSLIKAIDALPARIAGFSALLDTAESLRAALPDSVANFSTVDAVGTEVSPEDKALLSKALRAKNIVDAERNTIIQTEAKVGLIGLKPIESAKFGGFMLSVIIGVTAIAMSLPFGILLALGRQSDLMIVKAICVGFIEFIRGVPLITLLFVASTLLNYFLPPGTTFDLILRVVIMVTLFASAYMAEVVRGGLAALPTGQYEAADALGLDYWKATRLIIMPQALKISIPGIVSEFIGLFKDTTLVSIIGLMDPIGLTNTIRADANWNGVVWELYGFIALVFFIFCFFMSRYSMYLERKLKTGH